MPVIIMNKCFHRRTCPFLFLVLDDIERLLASTNLVKDKIFRLTVSLHISDVLPWFVQSEEE